MCTAPSLPRFSLQQGGLMRYIFSTEGTRRLAGILREQPLLAFDFDGTLAPIAPVPADAMVPLSVDTAMQRLCAVAPVAIISGRNVADIRRRLGFEPAYVVGNHGAEGVPGADTPEQEAIVADWFQHLAAQQEALPEGVLIERKRFSLSLHYRLARSREQALAVIDALTATLLPPPVRLGGKCVVNLLPPGSPDKYLALRHLLQQENRATALYVGDDETDEAIFRQAAPGWLTIRVEYAARSAADYYIGNQREIATLIQAIAGQWRTTTKETPWPP